MTTQTLGNDKGSGRIQISKRTTLAWREGISAPSPHVGHCTGRYSRGWPLDSRTSPAPTCACPQVHVFNYRSVHFLDNWLHGPLLTYQVSLQVIIKTYLWQVGRMLTCTSLIRVHYYVSTLNIKSGLHTDQEFLGVSSVHAYSLPFIQGH